VPWYFVIKTADSTQPIQPPNEASMPRNSPMPAFVAPQVPVLSTEPPTGGGWIHEIKHDGFRTLLRVDSGKAQAFSRGVNDTVASALLITTACRLFSFGSS